MCVSSRTSIISANFQRLSQVLKKISPLRSDNTHSIKSFQKKSHSRCISSCQQHIKLYQFSQQNTHCRTAFLQNGSLGAPNLSYCTFVLCEYQKINSSALPVIFISFKIINEKINFQRQQLKIEIEQQLKSNKKIWEILEINKVRMIKQNWILKETYENINWNNANPRHFTK